MLALLKFSTALSEPTAKTWIGFKQRHGKKYTSTAEESRRLDIFTANAAAIAERGLSWESLAGPFADESEADFTAARNGYRATERSRYSSGSVHRASGKSLPASVDWRESNLVTDPKDQGSCGSCWAFSTVASIEGQHAKQTGKLVSLSEQSLVDCVKGIKLPNDTDTCCMGCQGGLMDDAFAYLTQKQAGGIDTEAAYPYAGRAGTCAFKKDDVGATIGGWVDIPPGNETALLDAVATVGPVSVAVDASIGWQMYFGGILKPLLCSSKQGKMDHGVTVVGYGSEGSTDYWIVKNSWGAHWGEKGFVRLLRGKNACGIANAASYPKDISVGSAADWTWELTMDVFEGVLQGFFLSSTFPDLKTCASDGADAYAQIKAAIGEIEQMSADSIAKGLADLGDALGKLKAALVDCKAAEADVAKFAAAVEHGFKHPLSFLFHVGKELLVNGKDILHEISTAVADWKAESYRDAGVQIGTALSKLLEQQRVVAAR